MIDALHVRAQELFDQGFTARRTLRRLRREYPAAEIFDLHAAAGVGITGIFPLWAQIGHPIHPVTCRNDPRSKRRFL